MSTATINSLAASAKGNPAHEPALFRALSDALPSRVRGACARRGLRFPQADLDDLAQDVLLAVVEKDWPAFDPARAPYGGFVAFLDERIGWEVSGVAAAFARARTTSLDAVCDIDGEERQDRIVYADAPYASLRADEGIDRARQHRRLRAALGALDEPLRAAVEAVDLKGQSLEDAARALGVSRWVLVQRRDKALVKLRAALVEPRDGEMERRSA